MENFEDLMELTDDPRFGDVVIMYNKINPNDRVMKKMMVINDEMKFASRERKAEQRLLLTHPNLLTLLDYEINPDQHRIVYYYEYLDDLIQLEDLSPDQIIILFKDILKALCFMKEKQIVHGDVRPEFVAFDKLEQKYVLLDRLSSDCSPIECQKTNINDYRSLFMSPEVFNNLIFDKKVVLGNSDDLFSLGFMILSRFEDSEIIQDFYDFDQNVFLIDDLQKKLEDMVNRNLKENELIFLKFLKSFILVKSSERFNSQEALVQLVSIPGLRPLFKNDYDLSELMEQTALVGEEKPDENLNYYNPYSFVDKEENLNLNRKEGTSIAEDKFSLMQNSLVNINDTTRVRKEAEQNKLLILTDKPHLLPKSMEDVNKRQETKPKEVEDPKEVEYPKDIKFEFRLDDMDKLQPLKFFTIRT